MAVSHRRKAAEVNPYDITVHFSPTVKEILGELHEAVKASPHFDADIRSVLHEWATTVTPTLESVLITLPVLAQETFGHIQATGDQNAAHAWKEFSNQMVQERPFTLAGKVRQR